MSRSPFSRRLLCLGSFLMAPSLALAHHGQDYLLVESPALPSSGSAYLIGSGHVALSKEADERASFAPALLVGVTPRLALEMHVHTERTADAGWTYEAIAPAVKILLTDPGKQVGFKAGISAEYEFAAEDDDGDEVELRLSLEIGDELARWTANPVANREEGGDSDLQAALGVRRAMHPGFAIGVEAQGSLRHSEGAQMLAAAYFENRRLGTVKIDMGGERTALVGYIPTAHFGWVLPLHSMH